MADQPRLILQLPRGGAVDRQLSAQMPASVRGGEVVVEHGPTDARGHLEPPAAGQVVLSLPSPEALKREAAEVRLVIRQAVTAAEEIREDELAEVIDAATHTSRGVILRIIRDG